MKSKGNINSNSLYQWFMAGRVYTFHRSQYEQIDNLQLYSKIINIPPIQNQRHFFTFLASLIQVKLTSFKIFSDLFYLYLLFTNFIKEKYKKKNKLHIILNNLGENWIIYYLLHLLDLLFSTLWKCWIFSVGYQWIVLYSGLMTCQPGCSSL